MDSIKRFSYRLGLLFNLTLMLVSVNVFAAPTEISGVINSYLKGLGDVTAGSHKIYFDDTLNSGGYVGGFRGAASSISAGDVLLLVQSQGAEIDASNTDRYGDGVGAGIDISTIETSLHGTDAYAGGLISQSAGTFEYVTVARVLGNEITLSDNLNNDFWDANEANWQIVTMTNYGIDGVRLVGDVVPLAWDGDTGGIVSVYAIGGQLDFNGFTIEAIAKGFRGGIERRRGATDENVASIVDADDRFFFGSIMGGKGEGIAGTPRRIWDGSNIIDEGVSTLPGGDLGRGAPGNAGGGAGPHNSGGGGGSNAGRGGTGAQGYTGGGTILSFAGYGGQSILAGANMGGGGGSGESNNNFINHGGVGGGVVFVRAETATGTGSVDVSGGDGVAPNGNDGAGGAGASGSILMYFSAATDLPDLIARGNGGDGADTSNHGGGGGGGAGYVITNATIGTVETLPGAPGAGSGNNDTETPSEPGGEPITPPVDGPDAFITLNTDFGDAPDSYGTISGANGAYHSFSDTDFDGFLGTLERLYLGQGASGEAGGIPSIDADTDDFDDGILAFPILGLSASSYTIPANLISVTNTVGETATLHAWIDFDNSGTFDSGEHTSITVSDGLIRAEAEADLDWGSITVSPSFSIGDNIYARFRLTTDSDIDSTTPAGGAVSGEVEDYAFTISSLPDVLPDIADASVTIDEHLATGTLVYDINDESAGSNDRDGNGTALGYSITSGNDAGAFAINASTGEITVNDSDLVDFETQTSFTLSVSASDGLATDTADITINLNNITEVASSSDSTVIVSDDFAFADDVDTNEVTAIILDAFGNPVSGELVTFSDNGTDITFVGGSICSTGLDGRCSVSITSTVVEDVDISASILAMLALSNSPQTMSFTTPLSLTGVVNSDIQEGLSYTSAIPTLNGTATGTVTYTFDGSSADNGLFTIDANTGVVSMVARDFEGPEDVDTDNDYEVGIIATDSAGNQVTLAWTVTVTDVTEVASFTLDAVSATAVTENVAYDSGVLSLSGDTPIGSVTYAFDGVSADNADFTFDPATGRVQMVARNFEAPADANTNNVYEVGVTATDADGNTDTLAWTVTVGDVTEASSFNIDAVTAVSVSENAAYNSGVLSLSGDAPIGSVVYAFDGSSADNADFTIDSATGRVQMVARNFEAPADANTNNVYEVGVTATDSDGNSDSIFWVVTVGDVIEAASFTIDNATAVNVSENNPYDSGVLSLSGNAPIGSVSYAFDGVSADNADFTIDSATGRVQMLARDFENPADANTNNIYEVGVTVTDADGNADTLTWTVTVGDVTEAAAFTVDAVAATSVSENSAYDSGVMSLSGDAPVGDVTYTFDGVSADNADFTIDAATGRVQMIARDFESPVDANANNIYEVGVTATDADGNTDTVTWSVSVSDATESSSFTIDAVSTSVPENSAYDSGVLSLSGDTPVGDVTYAFDGVSADNARFTIDSATGRVQMNAQDFESPADVDGDNIYELGVTVTDADGNTDTLTWVVSVADVTEVVSFTLDAVSALSVSENNAYDSGVLSLSGDAPIGDVTYAFDASSADNADFTIDAATGRVQMIGRDFEAPADANANNSYEVGVVVTDADGNSDALTWTVSVSDVTESASFTIDAVSTTNVSENSAYDSGVLSLSGDAPVGTVTYAFDGVSVDNTDFTIDSSTGRVQMIARDFESPADANGNNEYEVGVTATDVDGNANTLTWTVTVDNVLESASAANSSVTITTSADTKTADGSDAHTAQVTVQDALGNVVDDGTVINFSSTDAEASFSASSCTTTNGQCSVTLTSTKSGSINVAIASGAISLDSTSANFVAGAADATTSSVAITTSATVIANGSDTNSAQVTIRDAQGNLVADGTVITFTSSDPEASFTPTTCSTVNGQCSVNVSSTKSGSIDVSIAVGATDLGSTTASFAAGSSNAANSSVVITTSADTVVADGADAHIAQATIQDAQGNTVIDGTVVDFSSSDFGVSFSSGSCSTVSGQCSVNVMSTQSGTLNINVSVNSANLGSASATFIAGQASADNSNITVTSNGSTRVANGSDVHTLEVVIQDVNGNTVADGTTVDFVSDDVEAGFTPTSCTTLNGVCTVSVSSTKSGDIDVSIEVSGNELATATASFVAGSPAAGNSHVSISTSSEIKVANGVDAHTVLVDVADENGNVVADGTVISFSSTDAEASFSALTCMTLNGQCSVEMSSTKAGDINISIASGATNLSSATANFLADALSAINSQISVLTPIGHPTGAIAGSLIASENTNTIVITLRDDSNNILANVNPGVVDLTGLENAVIESATDTSDSLGNIYIELTDAQAEDLTIGFTVAMVSSGAANTVSVSFIAGPLTDSDDDGVTDFIEQLEGTDPKDDTVLLDTDNDTIPDALDSDSDGDGETDIVESGGIDPYGDADGDGIPNYLDVDDIGDGIGTDAVCTDVAVIFGACDFGPDFDNPALDPQFDMDGDGIPNHIDADTDGDEVLDGIEKAEGSDHRDANDFVNTDAPADTIPDALEADSDNDGISNVDESEGIDPYADKDSDGIPNYLDADNRGDVDDSPSICNDLAPADGVCDVNEPLDPSFDFDQDGIANHRDTDSDNDGISDEDEGDDDTDDDGTPDYKDEDSDNDGISDEDEGDGDTDNDGTPDYKDEDSDNDGISDEDEGDDDTDNDGTPDYKDEDSDNDGISDENEGDNDTDNDGTPDYKDEDSDNDGISDEDEGNDDTDNDGTPDYKDEDSDNDGISDENEGDDDTDNDGTPDYKDEDSDNDGISDEDEGDSDADGDGTPDSLDSDSDGDGIPDGEEGSGDSDGDDIPDSRDPDSDNDGIPDVDEGNNDSDDDGIADYRDADSDNDGIPDAIESGMSGDNPASEPVDTDEDGTPDHLDDDSDNDGVPDVLEASSSLDTDGDGIYDEYDTDPNDPDVNTVRDDVTARDTDGDGLADFRDADSDNDGIADGVEAGIVDPRDSDSDGIDDIFDNDDGIDDRDASEDRNGDNILDALLDTDGDGIPNIRDLDSDNDLIMDVIEAGLADENADGFADNNALIKDYHLLPDSDTDGIADYIDVMSNGSDLDITTGEHADQDTNGDGVVDNITDADGDGIADVVDANPDEFGENVDTPISARPEPENDDDNDGIKNKYEGLDGEDADGDGIPNYLDDDSDGDGILDRDEASGRAANYDAETAPADTDGDGIYDFLDTDSDNDGYSDELEIGDYNGDGVEDRLQSDRGVRTQLKGNGSEQGSLQGFGILSLMLLLFSRRYALRKPLRLAAAFSLLAMLSVQSQAAESVCEPTWTGEVEIPNCWYVGGGIGLGFLEPDDRRSVWKVTDEHDTSLKLHVGYHFLPHFGAEISYHDLGAAGLKHRSPLINDKGEMKYRTFAVYGTYHWHELDETWNYYAKAGLATIDNSSTDSNLDHRENRDFQVAMAAGVQYQFAPKWFSRAEFEAFDKDAKALSLSINYMFGKKAKPKPKIDTDKDGVLDEADHCPNTQAGAKVDEKGCALDGDKDGVIDFSDACPRTLAGVEVDSNGCERDDDSDNIVNRLDQCPDTTLGAKVDEKGCYIILKEAVTFTLNVNFASQKTELDKASIAEVANLASFLKEYPQTKIELGGHTDSAGSAKYNQQLSEKRAAAVLSVLADYYSIDKKRLSSIGFGESKPIASNKTREGKAKNRRVEAKVEAIVEKVLK